MASIPESSKQTRPCIRGVLVFIALLVVARFVLELAGVSHHSTRWLSSSAAVFLAALYVGALTSMAGKARWRSLILPAIWLAVWTQAWIILMTIISAVFRLERSHFAESADYGNWSHLGQHILGHAIETVAFAVVVLILMTVTHLLRRWPLAVGPAALLGALVVIRYWVEAMGTPTTSAAAVSSTLAVLLCAFYLGGVSPGASARALFPVSLAIGWAWRFWVFLAVLLSSASPFYRTHFFDPTKGRVPTRLLGELISNIIAGFIAGLVIWGIAVWISRAGARARRVSEAQP